MKAGHKGRVLCLASYYLPGFKSGGPLRSLLHMQEWLGEEFEFSVLTRDHDLAIPRPYDGVPTGRWCPVRGVRVWYLSAPYWWPPALRRALRDSGAELLHFNSAIDPSITIMPLLLRRLGWIPGGIPVIVAPRGEFSAGARSIKHVKKNLYFLFARALNLYGNVTWHATKEEEAERIRALWGANVTVVVAPNLPARISAAWELRRRPKQAGRLRLVFLSRISPMKNLLGALTMLRAVTAPVEFAIYGPTEDAGYWVECQQLITQLPANVLVTYKGVVAPEDVIPTLAQYDTFFLPTLGENFGHVILEALLAGCPVLLSDRTPWRHLSAVQAGFDLPLEEPSSFQRAVEQFAAMDDLEFGTWSVGARSCGLKYANHPGHVQATRSLLAAAMAAKT